MTLPLDNRESNNYIHALERQFGGKLRNARDMSVFFTTRGDTADSDENGWNAMFEEYKILIWDAQFPTPSNSAPLDTQLSIGHYQIWTDNGAAFAVSGDGVLQFATGVYFIPSGAEVTVTQDGAGTVPSAETFVVWEVDTPFIAWVFANEGSIDYLFPHTGKAWYGALTVPAESGSDTDVAIVVLLKADGTYHVKRLGNKINTNFEFFTHLYLVDNPSAEVYFTGKELTYVPEGLPTGDYVAPSFTYTPD